MYAKCTRILALSIAFAFGSPLSAQLQSGRTVIMIGSPGSGKTVQSDILRKSYKIPVISMAELLHQEINLKSPIGKALAANMNSGEFLSDTSADELMKTRLMRPDAAHGFILDGYPATEHQAKSLDLWLSEHNLGKPVIIVLNVPEEVSRERILRRKKAGDVPANVERRLRDYRAVGRLVEQWYGKDRIVEVDGTGTPANVALRITNGIEAMKAAPVLKVRSQEGGGLKKREPAPPPTEPTP